MLCEVHCISYMEEGVWKWDILNIDVQKHLSDKRVSNVKVYQPAVLDGYHPSLAKNDPTSDHKVEFSIKI